MPNTDLDPAAQAKEGEREMQARAIGSDFIRAVNAVVEMAGYWYRKEQMVYELRQIAHRLEDEIDQ